MVVSSPVVKVGLFPILRSCIHFVRKDGRKGSDLQGFARQFEKGTGGILIKNRLHSIL